MRCPNHPDEWLMSNFLETEGYCIQCQEWFDLEHENEKAMLRASELGQIELSIRNMNLWFYHVKHNKLSLSAFRKLLDGDFQEMLKSIGRIEEFG
jgi:hypothetical protein